MENIVYNELSISIYRVDVCIVERYVSNCDGNRSKRQLEVDFHLIHKWVSLMPDAHAGMGMPISGVIATTGVIIPNAVGVDIGCGMAFVGTDIKVDEIREVMTETMGYACKWELAHAHHFGVIRSPFPQ